MRRSPESPLSFQAEGIVIRTHASGDSSLVVKIMTAERGKLAIFAKNARASSKNFRSGLELFDAGLFTLAPGGGELLKVSEFVSRPAFRALREDFDKLTAGGGICEAVDILAGDSGEAHLYQVLQLGLSAISEAKNTKDVLRATFLGLGSLLVRQGLLDPESEPAPTARGLERLCTALEDGSGQRFNSREAILMIAKGLGARRAAEN